MIKLNLTATTPEQEKIKAYLENNVSETLAEKINNGVQTVKDGKTLIRKKTLDSFMDYANAEARKIAAKGSKCACIDDATVYGWAIHYFEESSIEGGTLYYPNGTEYKVQATVKPATPAVVKPAEKPKPQLSLFDMVDNSAESADDTDENEPTDDEETDGEVHEETENEQYTHDEMQEIYEQEQQLETITEQSKVKQYYQCYLNIQEVYPDSIIAYRLGDFFEIFGDNAKLIANELNMTLTGRDVGLKERVPMIGIPFHAMDVCVPKIVSKGYKIAVVEPEGEIQTFEPTPKAEPKTEYYTNPAQSEDEILAHEREIAKAFDKNALIILSDLFGDIFTLE